MYRNIFNEPKPANAAEISAALNEFDMLPGLAMATLFEPSDLNEAPFDGWTAEIMDAETGDNSIGTAGFASRTDLEAALREAGIQHIEEGW